MSSSEVCVSFARLFRSRHYYSWRLVRTLCCGCVKIHPKQKNYATLRPGMVQHRKILDDKTLIESDISVSGVQIPC